MPSYATSYYPGKGAGAPRPSTSSTTASSNSAQSGYSSRSYGTKPKTPVIIHNGGGQTYSDNTSSNTGNSGYWP